MSPDSVVKTVTISRPGVVALIEMAARQCTWGNKTEVVALAVSRLLDQTARGKDARSQNARSGSLFGAHPGSVRVRPGVDLTAPVIDLLEAEVTTDGEDTGRPTAVGGQS